MRINVTSVFVDDQDEGAGVLHRHARLREEERRPDGRAPLADRRLARRARRRRVAARARRAPRRRAVQGGARRGRHPGHVVRRRRRDTPSTNGCPRSASPSLSPRPRWVPSRPPSSTTRAGTSSRSRRLRVRRRQGERQRLAVGAGPQRVVGVDRLLERDRHRVVATTGAVHAGLRRTSDPQRLAAARTRRCVRLARVGRRTASRRRRCEMTLAVVVAVYSLRHARRERAERRRRRRARGSASPGRCRRRRSSSPILIVSCGSCSRRRVAGS